MPTLVESDYPDMPEIEITLDGVVSLLQKIKPFKVFNPDQIPNKYSERSCWGDRTYTIATVPVLFLAIKIT